MSNIHPVIAEPTNLTRSATRARQVPPPLRLSLTIVEAANSIGISRRQIYVELEARRLSSVRVGSRRLILVQELARWLGARPPA